MRVAKKKRPRLSTKSATSALNGDRQSLRNLKAFGLWTERSDLKDPVQFTKEIRNRMEHGNDAR